MRRLMLLPRIFPGIKSRLCRVCLSEVVRSLALMPTPPHSFFEGLISRSYSRKKSSALLVPSRPLKEQKTRARPRNLSRMKQNLTPFLPPRPTPGTSVHIYIFFRVLLFFCVFVVCFQELQSSTEDVTQRLEHASSAAACTIDKVGALNQPQPGVLLPG